MARKPRVQFPGAFYHVLVRGNRLEAIFFDDTDRKEYLRRLGEARRRFDFTLYAYVLMPNHVHLLLEMGLVTLSRIMQWLGTTYTQYFNRRHHKIGHLFQGRYKAILCDQDSYFLSLVRYIHLNPVRAGLVKDPAEYPWSSHRTYVGLAHDSMIARSVVLKQFGRELTQAVGAYQEYITQGVSQGHEPRYYQVVDQLFLGDERFVARMKRQAGEPSKSHRRRVIGSLDEIVRHVAQALNVDVKALRKPSKVRPVVEARNILSYIVREYSDQKGASLAGILNVDPSIVSRGAERIAQRVQKKRDLGQFIERLVISLTSK